MLSGYIIKKRRGTEPIPRTLETEAPLWGIGDFIRIAIIFIFLSYTFSAFSYILKLHFSGEGLDRRAGLVASTTFMDFLIFMFVLRFVIVKYKQNISALGISAKRLVKNIMVGVYSYVGFLPILTVLFLTVLVIAKLLNYTPPPEPVYELIFEEKRPYLLVIISCLIALLGPIIEEVFFRGFLYTALRKRAGVLFSILISASLFSLLHTNLLGFVPILALGMLLAYVREKTGSLIPSITIHVIHNTALAGMMFFVRELSSKTL